NLYGGDGDNLINAANASKIKTFIQGNDGNDTLRGGAKNDGLQGNAGNDNLVGNGGDDQLNGGGGSDRIFITSDNDITLTNTQVTGEGTDTLISIEDANLYGGDGDNLINAANASKIKTFIQGNDGNDTLRGGAKNDGLQGNAGNDNLIGNGGDDKLNGGAGSDRLFIKSNNNITLTDTQVIGNGTDTLISIEAANLDGGGDDNLINAANANNISTSIKGNGGNDTLRGGAKNDGLQGNAGNDTLVGGAGNDNLNGGADDDFLKGDAGNDTLLGGAGNDVFALRPTSGKDVIRDFQDGFDSFKLLNSLAFTDLGISDNAEGTAALIRDLSNSNQLLATVNNVRADDLTASDFSDI
ncbi:MAG: calcium-binding protein, partial [Cyanobacteria bacterium P01_G01_bin.67]